MKSTRGMKVKVVVGLGRSYKIIRVRSCKLKILYIDFVDLKIAREGYKVGRWLHQICSQQQLQCCQVKRQRLYQETRFQEHRTKNSEQYCYYLKII